MFLVASVGRQRNAVLIILLFSSLLVLAPFSSSAVRSVTLAWDPSVSTTVAGYHIYCGGASATYTNTVDAGNSTNATISGLNEGGTYFFTVTAYDSSGMESDFSNEINYTIPVTSNAPPTLDSLADVSINENSGFQTVDLSGISSGATNESQTLTVTASSSNTGLVPNPAVTYTSPNAAGSITFTPLVNAYGSATITVTVNDGGLSNNIVSKSLTVTVNPVNQVPTLNALSNVTINQNAGLQTVNLSGISSGATNESQTLTVTASSSNIGLILNPTVSYTSPSATGYISFTPKAKAHGLATITVTVKDGGVSNNIISRSFSVMVNEPPTISAINKLTIAVSTSTWPIPFTIGDAETPLSSLTLSASSSDKSLVQNTGIVLGGSGSGRTVTVTPLSGHSGRANITITVSDGFATASSSFQLSVQSRLTAPGNFRIAQALP